MGNFSPDTLLNFLRDLQKYFKELLEAIKNLFGLGNEEPPAETE